MSEKPLKLRISIPPVEGIEDVPVAAAESIAHKMGFDSADVQDIVQAVTEACVNAILYSTSDFDVEVILWITQKSLLVEVRDRGSGFDPDNVPPPDFAVITDMGVKNGGFGIHMIKALMDKVEIESSDQGTTIRMSKFLP
ncbi:MAG: ATP-binding protein [Pseudanabaena sp. ELA607]